MRLGRDAELKFLPSGEAVANLSLAFNYGKAGADGNRPTQWIDGSLWGKRAESLTQYLVKGSVHCFTLNDVHIETYKKNDGSEGFKLSGMIADVELGPRTGERQAPQPVGGARPLPQDTRKTPNFSNMDDDIPF